MAFGMSPFPLRFGSRQGGGVSDPTALTPEWLTQLGITTARTGLAQYPTTLAKQPADWLDVGANAPILEPVTVNGQTVMGLVAQGASTPLVADSDDLTGWDTSGSPSVVYTASGGLGAAGYTTITGTGSAWTVSKSITDASANRRSRVRYYAPDSNSGSITLSQDDSSTTVTAIEGSVQDVALAAQTAANPVLEVAGSGTDQIIIYDFQHTKPSAGIPVYKWPRPQGETPAAIGGTTYTRAISAPTSIDVEILLRCPEAHSSFIPIFFALSNNGFNELFSLQRNSSNNLFLQDVVGGVSRAFTVSVAPVPGTIYKVQIQKTTVFRARVDDGAWVDGTFQAHSALINKLNIGTVHNGSFPAHGPILAIRDNVGGLFANGETGFNLQALDA